MPMGILLRLSFSVFVLCFSVYSSDSYRLFKTKVKSNTFMASINGTTNSSFYLYFQERGGKLTVPATNTQLAGGLRLLMGLCIDSQSEECRTEISLAQFYDQIIRDQRKNLSVEDYQRMFNESFSVPCVTKRHLVEGKEKYFLQCDTSLLSQHSFSELSFLLGDIEKFEVELIEDMTGPVRTMTPAESFKKALEKRKRSFNEYGLDKNFSIYRSSVFQVLGTETMPTNYTQISSATGFFISDDGFFLTSYQMIKPLDICLARGKCSLILNRPQGTKLVESAKLVVQVYTCSREFDFCLLKLVDDDCPLLIKPLPLESKVVSEDLLAMGYPEKRIEELNRPYELLFSLGSPYGFDQQLVLTSNHIFQGMNGGPVVNRSTGAVVGLVSKALKTGENTYYGQIQNLSVIQEKFHLNDYLSGALQQKVDRSLSIIEKSSRKKALKAVKDLRLLRTYYGVPELYELMINHKNKDVRIAIYDFLSDLGLFAGLFFPR